MALVPDDGAAAPEVASAATALDSMSSSSMDDLLRTAQEVIEAATAKSTVFVMTDADYDETDTDANSAANTRATTTTPCFDIGEIKLGRVVGRGGFCVVREVADLRLLSRHQPHQQPPSLTWGSEATLQTECPSTSSANHASHAPMNFGVAVADGKDFRRRRRKWPWSSCHVSEDRGNRANVPLTPSSSRHYMSHRVRHNGEKYVIKQVKPELCYVDKVSFVRAMVDITLESKFLASLSHPNIIKLRAQGCDKHSSREFCGTNMFLVLDHLPVTLPKRLNAWMHVDRSNRGVTGLVFGSPQRARDLWRERLVVAHEMASAGAYLHEKNIVFRDFKPDNVGFCARGITKLFDFGLAKELTNEPCCNNTDDGDLYLLTGLTGGIRYMAPEVARSQPYNTKADIYSWSMVLWYIMALEPPLGLYPPNVFIDLVVVKGYRPPIQPKWSPLLSRLLEQCWSENIWERPSFLQIQCELQKAMESIDANAASSMKLNEDDRVV
jgi:serine/threonine protein kinase